MQEFLICLFSLEPRGCRDFLRPSPTVMLKASVEVQFKFRRVFQLSLAHPARSLGSSSRSQFAFEPLKFTDNGRIIFASEKDGPTTSTRSLLPVDLLSSYSTKSIVNHCHSAL